MFHSRNPKYRAPTGAVEAGAPVHVRITLPRELSCSAARLIMEREGDPAIIQDMFWCGMNGDNREWWEHIISGEYSSYFDRMYGERLQAD